MAGWRALAACVKSLIRALFWRAICLLCSEVFRTDFRDCLPCDLPFGKWSDLPYVIILGS